MMAAKDLYEGKRKEGTFDQNYIDQVYTELGKAAAKGYGNDWIKVHNTHPVLQDQAAAKMKRNLYKFSMARDVTMLEKINDLMYDEHGNLRPYREFESDVLKLNELYNLNYLKTEFRTATQSGHHAANWEAYQANKKLFPNLEYRTQGDNKVRDEHRKLDGIIAPLDDPFWDKAFPPSGWNCRCYTVQTAADVSKDIPTEFHDILPEFQINIGQTGQVFSEGDQAKPHPFFAVSKAVLGDKLKVAFEYGKLNAPYIEVYKNGKSKIEQSIFADDKDLKGNLLGAKLIVDQLKTDVFIRPHLDTNLVKGYTNPEYLINGLLADRKAPESNKSIRNCFDSSLKQMGPKSKIFANRPYIIVIDFDERMNEPLNKKALKDRILGNVSDRRGKLIYSIIMIYKKKCIEITRESILKNNLSQIDKLL